MWHRNVSNFGGPAYLWGILGQWDILILNLTFIGFTNFFRCPIFDLSFSKNADVVAIKDDNLNKIRETNAMEVKLKIKMSH